MWLGFRVLQFSFYAEPTKIDEIHISVDLLLSNIEQITCIHVFFPRNFFVENLKFFSFFALKESRSSRYHDQSFFPKSKHEIRINKDVFAIFDSLVGNKYSTLHSSVKKK